MGLDEAFAIFLEPLVDRELEIIKNMHIDKLSKVEAFKYKDQTFDTFDKALNAEIKDKFVSIIGGPSSTAGSYFLSYIWASFEPKINEIAELFSEYRAYQDSEEHPVIQHAPVHEAAGSGFGW